MTISSRTPEGRPNRCPVCRRRLRLSPSWPSADAPCPHCGSLVWFPPSKIRRTKDKLAPAADFTLDQFREQFEQVLSMGLMRELAARMPEMAEMIPEDEDSDGAIKRVQGMIDAMTGEERARPDILDKSRCHRIAAGAGVQAQEVDQFLEQFDQVRSLMNQMAQMSVQERIKWITGHEPPDEA